MGKALYQKYRSKSLQEIVGQPHITDVLSRALKQNRVTHAYLLTGPRGVGKTSIARILAHEINKLPYDETSSHLDIIEIDAASNNGVEDIRDLREKVQIAPVSADKKIYIIDEVHMLSKAAFNALLKTLEEPPEHVVFILATTDADKLPATIVSRTQRFGFRAVPRADVIAHLRTIADAEKLKISDKALELIAEHGDGSFRDSISLLDQLGGLADTKEGITRELVENLLGLAPHAIIDELLNALTSHKPQDVIRLLDSAEQQGIQGGVLASQLMRRIRTKLAETPSLSEVLDRLLDVSSSRQPSIKLLTVLVHAADEAKSRTVALQAAALEVSAPIKSLEAQATKAYPHMPKEKPATQMVAPPQNKPAQKEVEATEAPAKSTKQLNPQTSSSVPSGPFDWDAFVAHTKAHYVAIYSVLSKCRYELDGTHLKIYTGNAFYKKKLDDSKYAPAIHECLAAIGAGSLDIETIPTAPPPKDSQAAAVAAIMGGGEEIELVDL